MRCGVFLYGIVLIALAVTPARADMPSPVCASSQAGLVAGDSPGFGRTASGSRSENGETAITYVAVFGLLAGLWVSAVKPANVFQNHMVLQRDRPLMIWGTADPGEVLTVSFAGQSVDATADASGAWKAVLEPVAASTIPATLTIGDKEITDVLVGEVWLCSGQSNMQWAVVQSKDAETELAAARDYPTIRLCQVGFRVGLSGPIDDTEIRWSVCDPEAVRWFSAVGYHFGRSLSRELGVPVGLVHSSRGATEAEAWISRPALETLPFMADTLAASDDALRAFDQDAAMTAHAEEMAHWRAKADRPADERDGGLLDEFRWWDPPEWPVPAVRPGVPARLYNGMIHPIVPFGLRGVVWYQGEANTTRHAEYDALMRVLIRDWRERFGQGDLPFYYVQLANFGELQTKPVPESENWPRLREAQRRTLGVENTGMACAVDLADPDDPGNVHPGNKQEVGRRLSLWALAKTYGRDDLVYSGPMFETMTVVDDRAIISFRHLGGGLMTKDGKEVKGFAVTGDGASWVWADARIVGDTVVCTADGIAVPKAVRYAWAANPIANLYNQTGLPAVPFRTDGPA